MAIGSVSMEIWSLVIFCSLLLLCLEDNLRGGVGLLRSGSFLIELAGRSVTSLLVYFSGQGNNVPSLWDLSGLICQDKLGIFPRQSYSNTHTHTHTHTHTLMHLRAHGHTHSVGFWISELSKGGQVGLLSWWEDKKSCWKETRRLRLYTHLFGIVGGFVVSISFQWL